MRLDLFCRVVDNYGDAGVTWRLARQLVVEHGVAVTLWIDVPATLSRMVDGFDAGRDLDGLHDGVRVRRLDGAADTGVDALPAVVVEGFGCGLPPAYLNRMAAAPTPPVWINLEYLSAEPWIETVHGLPSPHPRLPLTRHFFFPGFTAATGGLLRERDLLARREAFQAARGAAPRSSASRAAPPSIASHAATPYTVSLFCYPNAALPALLDTWAAGDAPLLCRVPEGVAAAALRAWSGGAALAPGDTLTRGNLTIAGVRFGTQDEYDRLLWASDFNFVRGEDSFVRAQWAARPLAWHAYPQAGDAHVVKVDAFIDRYAAGLDPASADAVRSFAAAWNRGAALEVAHRWPALHSRHSALAAHANDWSARLATLPDLASSLLEFCRKRL